MSGGDETTARVSFGTAVYDENGAKLGQVRGFDEHGFYVTTDDGVQGLSSDHITAGNPGEAELVWRCWACGEVGDSEQSPEGCPACGVPREDIYYWQED